METPKPAERFSIDNQLLARIADLKSARIAWREVCLLHAQQPNNAERQRAVAELEAEIHGHELSIERLEAAKLAQSTVGEQEAEAARIDAARTAAQAVAALTPKMRASLERVVDAFEMTIGPALAELDSLNRERSGLIWTAAVNALGVDRARRDRATIDRLQADTPGTSALLAAIFRSRLGQVGPRIDPWVTFSAPSGGVGTPDKALASFDQQAQRIESFLAEAIQHATNPQPATVEE